MANQSEPIFRDQLLRQDHEITSQRYQEHRMELERRLIRAETRAQRCKWVAAGGLVLAAILFPVVASGILGGADPFDKNANVLSVGLAVLYVLALAVGLIGVASYYSRFVPGITRVRGEMVDEIWQALARDRDPQSPQ